MYKIKQEVLGRTNRHIENDTSNSYSIVVRVFVTVVTFLPSHCLATIGYTYRHAD
jgi:hypothetical protein